VLILLCGMLVRMSAVMTAMRRGVWVLSLIAPRAAGRVAFELFRHPLRRVAVRPHEVDTHRAATVEAVHVGGKAIVIYAWGDGVRPVLFLHGWESRGSRVAPLVQPLLDAGFSPISFDAPGHGDAASRGNSIPFYGAVAAYVDERWGPLAGIVGHSFGVPAGFYAVKSGVRAGCLVGVAGPCRFDYAADEFARRMRLLPSVRADVRRRVEKALLPLTDVWSALSADDRPELVSVPILLLHDDADPTVALAQAQRTQAAYGEQAELVVTSGLGHSRILADPEVVRRIVAFVAASAGP
jgi:pimeloyl-ACP methyl ester carboxylesterase